jgi:excinuclease ABC subunit A
MSNNKNRIKVRKANEHNLKSVDIEIPHNSFAVITGVSGSGKSSLVYDTLFREGERRYLGTFSSYARQFMGKMEKPMVGEITGLSPVISVDQKTVVRNPRSTVGTMTGIYDSLRLLFARLGNQEPGETGVKLERRLFSFNSSYGACPGCKGLGVQDKVDVELLIENPKKTLRQGALVITTKSGYIIYSQVTMEVLDQVCRANGFDVDIPWEDLTKEQKNVVLYGSDKIKIAFGKHPLESRLKWKGITAKPREEGYYKGIIPVIGNILKVDRNPNILRFVRSQTCEQCNGSRLNPQALSVTFQGRNIAELASLSIEEIQSFFRELKFNERESAIGETIRQEVLKSTNILGRLGLEYLTLDRESTTLSGGEAQRIRLATLIGELRGVLYIFDEPTIGLHHRDNQQLLEVLKILKDSGNTVLVVEHDDDTIRNSDWIVDIGPLAGESGGEVLFCGSTDEFFKKKGDAKWRDRSQTYAYLTGLLGMEIPVSRRQGIGELLQVKGAAHNNLKHIDVPFKLGVLNVVTGVSGAGKSTLVHDILGNSLRNQLHKTRTTPGAHKGLEGAEFIDKVIEIDQAPIGKTPRSNPATYTSMFDDIRTIFAELPESKSRGWKKGRFSFNVKGGRCEDCEGAGVKQIGMHFLGNVTIPCDVCGGKRFNPDTLEISYKGKTIFDVLEMSVDEASLFFEDQIGVKVVLETLKNLGLGYIGLGQSSTTLSGGEAQRIKLASELCRPGTGKTLYIMDEPTTGLHSADITVLLKALEKLVEKGNTIITVEHHPDFIKMADWIVDLGPGRGKKGGEIVAMGTPEAVAEMEGSDTGAFLKQIFNELTIGGRGESDVLPEFRNSLPGAIDKAADYPEPIQLKGVTTHNLKKIDVSIPINQITVITGVSGSGKSSLAFDTIFSEGQQRYLSSFSNYIRRLFTNRSRAEYETCHGLLPTVAISQKMMTHNPRSTVGTLTGIYDYYRLLFSRAGKRHCPDCGEQLTVNLCEGCGFFGEKVMSSTMFSFNHLSGACRECNGLGVVTVCDPGKIITHPDLSLLEGALQGTKTGKFYGDSHGQYIAILEAVGKELNIDFSVSWIQLEKEAKNIALFGTGERKFQVNWKYKRKNREGEHHFETLWMGFIPLVNQEYERKHADKRGASLRDLMQDKICPKCQGARLNPEVLSVSFAGISISQLCQKSVTESISFFKEIQQLSATSFYSLETRELAVSEGLSVEVLRRLSFLDDVGLGYLALNRSSSSLSCGESQRIRLASQLGAGLTNVTYVLDEPTIGLHSRDTHRLLEVLKSLRDMGNTVVMVEHDMDIIKSADYIIDLGPEGGMRGGHVVADGTVEQIMGNPNSKTGFYLKKNSSKTAFRSPRQMNLGIQIQGAFANNLKGIDVNIPSGGIVAVTGVSGSGKSSLLFDVLVASVESSHPKGCESITGIQTFDSIISVDQKAIGSSSHSNPATFIGIFDFIRNVFANTKEALENGYKKSLFSVNTKGGRCEECQGMGEIRTSMDFLADVWNICPECKGKRFQAKILECRYNGRSISDVLSLTVSEAIDLFREFFKITCVLEMMEEVGLGYLKLGQPGNTLSGGEAQRLKLVRELRQAGKGKNLYILDEPTIGLHLHDINYLASLFNKLVDSGHTVVFIEHHPDLIRSADWMIELGPEGGDQGGQILANGTPAEVAKNPFSHTGKLLKKF